MRTVRTLRRSDSTVQVRCGARFRSVIADCNALWEVKRHLGGGSWLCEVVNEPIEIHGKKYEGEHAGVQKSFLAREISGAMAMATMFTEMLSDHDQYYASLSVGQIVHYNNGFQQYIRCRVVYGKDKDGRDGNVLLPIALVGNWGRHDLPRRMRDGSICLGYHAKQIVENDTFTPNYSSIVESPSYRKHGDEPTATVIAELPPVDLTLPEMTAEEVEAARLARVCTAVVSFLNNTSDAKLALATVASVAKEATLTGSEIGAVGQDIVAMLQLVSTSAKTTLQGLATVVQSDERVRSPGSE